MDPGTLPQKRRRSGLRLRTWLLLCALFYPSGRLVTHLTVGEFGYVELCARCGAERACCERTLFGIVPIGTTRGIHETACQRFLRDRFGFVCRHPRWEFAVGAGGGTR